MEAPRFQQPLKEETSRALTRKPLRTLVESGYLLPPEREGTSPGGGTSLPPPNSTPWPLQGGLWQKPPVAAALEELRQQGWVLEAAPGSCWKKALLGWKCSSVKARLLLGGKALGGGLAMVALGLFVVVFLGLLAVGLGYVYPASLGWFKSSGLGPWLGGGGLGFYFFSALAIGLTEAKDSLGWQN